MRLIVESAQNYDRTTNRWEKIRRKKSQLNYILRAFSTHFTIEMTDHTIARVEINTLYFDWHSQKKRSPLEL